MSEERYVVTTVISTHRMRYAIPMSELAEEGVMPTVAEAISWTNDSVTMEEVEEFSQHWMGENIVDTFVLDEERVIQLLDRDNPHVADMTKEEKLKQIHNWKIKKQSV
jgi:hypothetical protein|tara:strand:+ start:1291 stop:1614 length:324 start_codon:yes stop_codon:yes gene_type:complete